MFRGAGLPLPPTAREHDHEAVARAAYLPGRGRDSEGSEARTVEGCEPGATVGVAEVRSGEALTGSATQRDRHTARRRKQPFTGAIDPFLPVAVLGSDDCLPQ